MNITFIGIGKVGFALADNLAKAGHQITIAARDAKSESVASAVSQNKSFQVAEPANAVAEADAIFLATPYQANAGALAGLNLTGKILVDCTNPVGPGLTHGLQSKTSGAEEVQKLAPGAKVVKAFTIFGFENLHDNHYPGYGDLKPVMLVAGDQAESKKVVLQLATELGWHATDAGPLASALHLEHMTLLWIKMGRVLGKGANFVWAMLER
jgi:predicted dinucleotide-binding enzyme